MYDSTVHACHGNCKWQRVEVRVWMNCQCMQEFLLQTTGCNMGIFYSLLYYLADRICKKMFSHCVTDMRSKWDAHLRLHTLHPRHTGAQRLPKVTQKQHVFLFFLVFCFCFCFSFFLFLFSFLFFFLFFLFFLSFLFFPFLSSSCSCCSCCSNSS